MDTVEHDGVFESKLDEVSRVRPGESACGVKNRIKKLMKFWYYTDDDHNISQNRKQK